MSKHLTLPDLAKRMHNIFRFGTQIVKKLNKAGEREGLIQVRFLDGASILVPREHAPVYQSTYEGRLGVITSKLVNLAKERLRNVIHSGPLDSDNGDRIQHLVDTIAAADTPTLMIQRSDTEGMVLLG